MLVLVRLIVKPMIIATRRQKTPTLVDRVPGFVSVLLVAATMGCSGSDETGAGPDAGVDAAPFREDPCLSNHSERTECCADGACGWFDEHGGCFLAVRMCEDDADCDGNPCADRRMYPHIPSNACLPAGGERWTWYGLCDAWVE